MRKLAAVSAAAVIASLAAASVASAADPIRSDKINQRFNGKTYKGTVKYPWPARWKKLTTTKAGDHYYAENLGGGCTAKIRTTWHLLAEFDSAVQLDIWGVVGHTTSLGSGTKASSIWTAFEGVKVINYGETVVPNRWIFSSEALTKLTTNRYYVHATWNDFFGTCTTAQLTTSPTANALVAAVRDQTVSIKIS